MESIISDATRRNWNKLSVTADNKLKSRANKQKSTKRIIPVEYLMDNIKIELIKKIIKNHSKNRIQDIIYYIAEKWLEKERVCHRQSVKKILQDFQTEQCIKPIHFDDFLPDFNRDDDFLGTLYQSFLSEGEKNRKGSYYTPFRIVDDMLSDFNLKESSRFLDPCCGSGAFLMRIRTR